MSGSVNKFIQAATTAASAPVASSPPSASPSPPLQAVDPRTVFSLRNEAGHTLMLDVRLRSGANLALPYAYLINVEFDPSTGLKAVFSSHMLMIKGRNLRPIYEGLLYHRVEWLQEGDARHDTLPENATWITGVQASPAER